MSNPIVLGLLVALILSSGLEVSRPREDHCFIINVRCERKKKEQRPFRCLPAFAMNPLNEPLLSGLRPRSSGEKKILLDKILEAIRVPIYIKKENPTRAEGPQAQKTTIFFFFENKESVRLFSM